VTRQLPALHAVFEIVNTCAQCYRRFEFDRSDCFIEESRPSLPRQLTIYSALDEGNFLTGHTVALWRSGFHRSLRMNRVSRATAPALLRRERKQLSVCFVTGTGSNTSCASAGGSNEVPAFCQQMSIDTIINGKVGQSFGKFVAWIELYVLLSSAKSR